MQRQQINISMPQIALQIYKNNSKQIEDLVKDLNSFTNRLQEKVSNMLKGQQTQFVNSYKAHMHKIQQCLKNYQAKIDENNKKIQYYENEGMLSNLLKKINFLENNEKKLLTNIQKKEKTILILKGEISTKQRQISSLEEKVKQILLKKQTLKKTIVQDQKHPDPSFATQTISKETVKSNGSMDQLHKDNQQYLTISPLPENPQHSQQLQIDQLGRFKKQLVTLKKKNRQLSSVNSKILEKATSIDQFFLNTVNELRKKIGNRKKITNCTFEDFKQEDKLQLLIKVLSNEEILQHLYNKIFKNKKNLDIQASRVEQKAENLVQTERTTGRLPIITYLRR